MNDFPSLAVAGQQISFEVIRSFAGIVQQSCGKRRNRTSFFKARCQFRCVVQMVIQRLRIAIIIFTR